jgi:alkylation response protein AidB-like acyl-CoA dehydrogenase
VRPTLAAVTNPALTDALERVDKIEAIVRAGADESESLGHLAPAVVDALHDSGLFRLVVPESFGGLGLMLPESIAVFERVGALDASTAWTLAILADGALFARFFEPSVFSELCSDPRGLICGSLNPTTATAEEIEGGFRFSGRATYLSGSAHAKWVMASAIVTRDGQPVSDEGGIGIQIRTGLLPIERTRGLDTWNVTGMRATGSNDHEIDGVDVSADHTFEPFRPRLREGDDVFHWIPLWSQLGSALAACAVGTARHAIDALVELAAVKVPLGNFSVLAERVPAQVAVAEAEGLYLAARAVLLEGAEATWARGVAHEPFGNDVLARFRLNSVTAARLAAQAIDLVHDAAGMNAVRTGSVLDRCWRDVHTMTQHVILAPARFEIVGRIMMGLDPNSPVI